MPASDRVIYGCMIKPEDLLHPRPEGLYCPPGDFFIDPVRRVDRAVVTHGHADHARAGHGAVMATRATLDIMQSRYGKTFTQSRQPADYGEPTTINGVSVKLIPAGHVLGSAQVVVEHDGCRMICTGDYKRRPDPTCAAFEVEACDVFISEATFALPVFKHPDDRGEIAKLMKSLSVFPYRTHLVGAYSLGKSQRVIALLREADYDETILITKPVEDLCALYERHGVRLGALEVVSTDTHKGERFAGRVVVGPSQSFSETFARRCADPVTAFASGWMNIRARARASGVELPLIISDHADWDELTETVSEVNPGELWITHGRADALTRWAQIEGRKARPLHLVGYDDETG